MWPQTEGNASQPGTFPSCNQFPLPQPTRRPDERLQGVECWCTSDNRADGEVASNSCRERWSSVIVFIDWGINTANSDKTSLRASSEVQPFLQRISGKLLSGRRHLVENAYAEFHINRSSTVENAERNSLKSLNKRWLSFKQTSAKRTFSERFL